MELCDALRDLLVFDQHETLVDELFEDLPVHHFRDGEDAHAQLVAMHVLFLLDRVTLTTLAPHALQTFGFDQAVFSK